MPPKTRRATAAAANAVSHLKPEKKSNRTSLSQQIHAEGKYEDTPEDDEDAKSKNDVIAQNLSPLQTGQLKFLRGAVKFLSANYSTEKFVITLLLGFLTNVMYAKYIDEYPEDISMVAFCWLGAVTSYTVSYIAQQNAINKAVDNGSIEADSPLSVARPPSFDRLYATVLPVMACFLIRKDLLVINLALTYLLLELPAAIKLFISVMVMYNFQHEENVLDCTFVPALHWVVETTLDQYLGESLSAVEKYSYATLFVNLMYAAPDNSDNTILVIFKYLVYWFGGLTLAGAVVGKFCSKQTNTVVKSVTLASLYLAFIGIFYTGVVASLTRVLGEHPLVYLRDFVTASELRYNILKVWLASFLTLVPLVVKISSSWDLQLKRKIWHFIVFGMLLYPTIVDPQLSQMGLVGLIGIFVLVELLRSSALPPLGPFLRSIMLPFQDERDNKGPVVISYLFLLCGIALPLFFNNSVAGIVCLGVGDSAASIIGKQIGQVQWFDGKKTMEGSMAFIFATTLAMYLYKFLGGVPYSWNTIFMSCVFTSILEGLCELNDNLVTPIFMFVMLEVLHYEK